MDEQKGKEGQWREKEKRKIIEPRLMTSVINVPIENTEVILEGYHDFFLFTLIPVFFIKWIQSSKTRTKYENRIISYARFILVYSSFVLFVSLIIFFSLRLSTCRSSILFYFFEMCVVRYFYGIIYCSLLSLILIEILNIFSLYILRGFFGFVDFL